jgi:hypothetical protein
MVSHPSLLGISLCLAGLASGCTTFYGISRDGETVHLTGETSFLFFGSHWVKRCVERERVLRCVELEVERGAAPLVTASASPPAPAIRPPPSGAPVQAAQPDGRAPLVTTTGADEHPLQTDERVRVRMKDGTSRIGRYRGRSDVQFVLEVDGKLVGVYVHEIENVDRAP